MTAGYYGYAIILTMSVLNFMYYGDLWYRRVILSRFTHWGMMLHTIWGVQAILRPLVNYMVWTIIGVAAAIAIVDSPNMYVMLGSVVGVMGFVYALRTFLVIMVMVLGIWFDNVYNYTNYTEDTNTTDRTFYRALYSWGNELRLWKPDTTYFTESTDESADEYYYMIDIQLEAFNILAGAAAYSFFDIGLKIWEPLAKMGINFIPKDMKYFRKALYMKKLKIYTRKFKDGQEEGKSATPDDEEEGEDADEAF